MKEYRQFMAGNNATKDPVERSLRDIADSLQRAWTGNRCQACPLAELAALAQATLTFYLEDKKRKGA
jgi:hypothetical protein